MFKSKLYKCFKYSNLYRIVELVMKIQPISKSFNTTEISDILDIDSQTLSSVFNKMRDYY